MIGQVADRSSRRAVRHGLVGVRSSLARIPWNFAPFVAALLVCCSVVSPSWAQTAPRQEFRAAWIATVGNLDWPSSKSASAATQKLELIRMLDRLKAAGINAVLFQVRNEADALFDSPYEPWSYFLTGLQGKDPGYDPLAFAVEEAHRRGMELHAWFNPYRVWISGRNYPRAESSVYRSRPEWLLTIKDEITILNPGIPAVQDYLVEIIRDVVTRYDVDGVHFDDYFYPYPPNGPSLEDLDTWTEFGSQFPTINAWRQHNVNELIRKVHEAMATVRPEVKFGISPFGIWKSGTPPGIAGLSGALDLYADALVWLDERWLDYLAPQLYWPFAYDTKTRQQDYALLAPWWAAQMNGRHLYPGLAVYRADRVTYPCNVGCTNPLFAVSEIPNQVRFNRADPRIDGAILFRAQNITGLVSGGIADTLRTDLFSHPALTPTMDWKDLIPPDPPGDFAIGWTGDDEVTLSWTPAPDDGFTARSRFFAVYRVQSATEPDWFAVMRGAGQMVGITGETSWSDRPAVSDEPYWYVVTAVSPNSVESNPTSAIAVEGRASSVERDVPAASWLDVPYPNPFRTATTFGYRLPTAGKLTIEVYDVLGRRVASLVEEGPVSAGAGQVAWETRGEQAPGNYFLVLRFDGRVLTQPVILAR